MERNFSMQHAGDNGSPDHQFSEQKYIEGRDKRRGPQDNIWEKPVVKG